VWFSHDGDREGTLEERKKDVGGLGTGASIVKKRGKRGIVAMGGAVLKIGSEEGVWGGGTRPTLAEKSRNVGKSGNSQLGER